ncbi:MAG: DUF3147 family protein [Proteobacteria bacterium]|nr:MAG: DUF3147 family protein [Pseudomonadota bacterium]
MFIIIKVLVTSLIIVGASELSKRWSFASTLLLALPLTSLLTLLWVFFETKDAGKVSQISWGVFWLVPPSLIFFPVLSLSLDRGISFPMALVFGAVAALITYIIYAKLLGYLGVHF